MIMDATVKNTADYNERFIEDLNDLIETEKENSLYILQNAIDRSENLGWSRMTSLAEAQHRLHYCKVLKYATEKHGNKRGLEICIENWTDTLMSNTLRGSSSNHFSNALEHTEREVVAQMISRFKGYIDKL